MKKLGLLILFSVVLSAQPTVAPTNVPVGAPRGEDFQGYNFTNWFETGYRFHTVGGDLGKYRSDVNFGNGVRLLGSNLTINSKEGHGKYFDELLLNTQGLGNDPYEFASFRVQKNRFYRYDLLWRLNDYYNPALPISNGQHFMNTQRRLQDHSIVLLPQSNFRIFAGYSHNNQDGPALSTTQLFDSRGDEFPLFSDVRRTQDEYRVGAEFRVLGTVLSFLRTWEYFKDDTRLTANNLAGNDTSDQTALNALRRDEPYHGSTKGWRVNLRSDQSKLLAFNGRFTYSGGRRDFIFDESAVGIDRFGAARNRQILLFGDADRPVTTAGFTATLFPAEKFTITNHTFFHHTRMEGDASYRELNNATLGISYLQFNFLGIQTISNTTDLNYRMTDQVGVVAGYQYSNRRIRSIEQQTFEGVAEGVEAEQHNKLHSGRFGVRLHPAKPLTVTLDAEIGRADRPIYPISERNYHALGGRVQYKTGTLLLSALARTNYNTNSVSLFSHSAKSRNYAFDASWSALSWIGIDANYSKLHLDTLTGIAYFSMNQLVTDDKSVYVSNIHSGTAAVRLTFPRTDLYLGYSHIQDTGGDLIVPNVRIGYQSYPLRFSSPLARISIRLHPKLRWNAGYQHYGYSEQELSLQNYRAHTGFTSVTWSF